MTNALEPRPGWTNLIRRDGWVVLPRASGQFIAEHQIAGRTIEKCPCCLKPFATAEAARKTVDFLHHMAPEVTDE